MDDNDDISELGSKRGNEGMVCTLGCEKTNQSMFKLRCLDNSMTSLV